MILFLMVHMTIFLARAQLADSALCPAGCNCTNRRVIECAGAGLNTMPMRISPIVCEFKANNNSITELPGRMLSNAKTLQKLSLSRNNIENLRSNTFKNTASLTHLDLSYNRIRIIRVYTFFELSKLRVLNLEGNNITSISERAFAYVNSLQELILSNNKLRAIPSRLLEQQISLEILKLDGNKISTLANDVFRRQSALQLLDLSKNKIKRISDEVFRSLYLLKELRLRNNQIQEIDYALTDKVERKCMRTANSSEPTSTSVVQRKLFSQMTLLEVLDIGHNNLKLVTFESFAELTHLKSLLLKRNPWRCDCALRQAVQSFPPTLHHAVWDAATCNEPSDLKGSNVDDVFPNIVLTSAYPAPILATDVTVLSDPPITTENDVSPMTSTIGRNIGSNQGKKSETRHSTSNDSVPVPTVKEVFFKTLPVANTEESRTRGNDLENSSDTNKSLIPDKWWMVAAISVAIFITICGSLCGINKCLKKGQRRHRSPRKRSRGDEISFRTSSSNSRFFDYQFANRPLPQAPKETGRPLARNTPDEVRSSKRERCGSNTSGFISMRTYSSESNMRGSRNSNVFESKYQRGRTRSNTSIETAGTKFTETNPIRNKLPPLPCENTETTAAEKPFKEIAPTKTNRKAATKSKEGIFDRTTQNGQGGETQEGADPPSPPKRNESSKLRCQELLRKMKRREAKNQDAYCEIDEKDKTSESGENLLYKKYLQKMIDPYNSSQFSLQSTENSPHHQSTSQSSKYKTNDGHLFNSDEHYDRLSYNTRRRYDDTIDRFMNTTKDSCFNNADNDFVFSRPTEEEKLRRSSTGRLFKLRKQKENLQRRSMVVTKSPLASELQSYVKDQYGSNHTGVRAQSFSYAPRFSAANLSKQATPVIVVHEHDHVTQAHKNQCEISTNQQPYQPHRYEHLQFTHPDVLSQSNYPTEIPEERISDIDTRADNADFKNMHLKLPDSKYKTNSYDVSDATQASPSDKEEMDELKSLVQSILRSEKGDSKPASRADSMQEGSCISRSASNCDSQSGYLATPRKAFLNLSSEIDLTESDDAGYLSPLTTLGKKSNFEEEEIFGEIQLQDNHRSRNQNKRGLAKNKKAISGQRKSRKSSSNNPSQNSKDHYTSSESDNNYDSIPRKRISKPPRHFQKSNPTLSETDNSTVYMSIIDTDDPVIQPDVTHPNMTFAVKPEAAFHSREREIYIKASQDDNVEENCYEEIYTRQNSINLKHKSTTYKPYFCALKTKRNQGENYYQEVTKVPAKKRRNKRQKSKFTISSDQMV